jgi:hypothetical protein
MTNRKQRLFRGCVLVAIASSLCIALAAQIDAQTGGRPQYAPGGLLRLPVGFESWVFVGSNLGLSYKPDLPVTDARERARARPAQEPQLFHNVYIDPEAYAYFAATRQFPDPTILVMEIFKADAKDPKDGVLATGVFNGERVGLEVAVKDTRRPPSQPPVTTPWAYYTFQNPSASGPMRTTAPPDDPFCEACHKQHASMDNVWVQFYPTLRKLQ